VVTNILRDMNSNLKSLLFYTTGFVQQQNYLILTCSCFNNIIVFLHHTNDLFDHLFEFYGADYHCNCVHHRPVVCIIVEKKKKLRNEDLYNKQSKKAIVDR